MSPLFTHKWHWSCSPLAFPCLHSRKELSDVFLFYNLKKNFKYSSLNKNFLIENVVNLLIQLSELLRTFTIQLKFIQKHQTTYMSTSFKCIHQNYGPDKKVYPGTWYIRMTRGYLFIYLIETWVSTYTFIKGPFLLPFHFLQTSSSNLSTLTLDH